MVLSFTLPLPCLFELSLTFHLWQTPRRSPKTSLENLLNEPGSCCHYLSNVMLPLTTLGSACYRTNMQKQKKKELPVCSCDRSWRPRGNQMTLFGGDRKDYVWLPEDSQGIFSRSMTHSKNEWKMMAMQKWQHRLGMEVCFTLAGKEPNLLRSWRIRKHGVESGGKKWGSICSGLETTGKIRTIASTHIYLLVYCVVWHIHW